MQSLDKKNQDHEHTTHISPHYVEYAYAHLAKSRNIFIAEDITKNLAASLSAMLLYFDNVSETEDITLYINTNGGDIQALSNIYDIMQMIKSPIRTVCIGKAYSAGACILAAGAKGKRLITENASVMIHGIQCVFPSPHEDQKSSQIYYDHLKSMNKSIIDSLAKHTGKTFAKVYEDCKKDTFLDAKMALEYGIVDDII